ncbi:hypothetical protein TRFO_07778 [Tritrichomonas foetus]|uniref:Threonyl/alanyl tRNA synthetase SAD domain-containing protein n=1 Tax=Tritrichomonas foetus TaxID=1144522 RepID=A0A1J4JTH0_9EUKA|nr:hypothetical protein TRFO_07778 [Tritrichomonas foetus]|eukprot:OHT00796.1 hypothetical protein TRFO_07778 [Tritrichomonas foetus]
MSAHKNYDPRMHTTEHIFGRVMDNMFHCGKNITMHLEKKKSKCDFKFDRNITPEEKVQIEKNVNDVIAQKLDVKIYNVSREEAEKLVDTSKLPEDAKDATELRMVQVGDFDVSACIGQHVSNTSEIKGLFRITTTSFDNGVLRTRWVVK